MTEPIVIRGLGNAIARERLVRDAAFLTIDGEPLTEFIAKFEVFPMNLRHYTSLRLAGNPFVVKGGAPSVSHLVQFIWAVSVDYRPSRAIYEAWIQSSGLIDPPLPRFKTRRAMAKWSQRMADCIALQIQSAEGVQRYFAETFQDRPPVRQGSSAKSYYSDICFWSATLAREYGIPVERVPEMPIKQVFQFLKEIKDHSGKRDSLTNPSDEVIARWQMEQNRN